MTGYAGIIEYEPGEYTFTARAGTTVAVLRDALAAHGQYLPFDPPFAAGRRHPGRRGCEWAERVGALNGTAACAISSSACVLWTARPDGAAAARW
ncbi:MAG: hypothetical protein R2854_30180 [Caldilineaceae bacterium]